MSPKNNFVTEFVCTAANVHDSQVMEEVLEGDEKAIFADKAYDTRSFVGGAQGE
uniref:transposase n=1 Tax=Thermodesulfatator autotrophicus TaxID=1795632 RepID=UPI001E30E9CE|nr:transposase [Thermodesulfatator autotrophicus]